MWKAFVLICAFTASALEIINSAPADPPSFEVDHTNNRFLLDGKPFRYVSGSFHYFRTPRVYWRDRLRKMRTAGLNAISTYVEWSLHQPTVNTWRWTGEEDLVEFIKIAQQEGLLVLLRPGPYICAERNLGGLPPWLMTLVPDIKMRTNDARYMKYVEIYLNETLSRVKPLLRGNGGPIIMVQVENEYGSFRACDQAYTNKLRTIMARHVGTKALMYTTDGSRANEIRCGRIPGVYTTVDFGTGTNVTENFKVMRQFQPTGPLVNSEFYPGWLTHWEEPFQRVSTNSTIKVLNEMLALGASVNIYMFYGGTNFGFTSGANGPEDYSPQITSYDYDAPLTEAGDPTDKYYEISKLLKKYLPSPNRTLPIAAAKRNYGSVLLRPVVSLLSPAGKRLFGSVQSRHVKPPTFEKLGIAHSLVLYETDLPTIQGNSAVLRAVTHDRAHVFVDNYLIGILSRTHKKFTLPIPNPYSDRLRLLVENQGHLNFGNLIEDFKGLLDARINNVTLTSWNVTGFKLDTVKSLATLGNSAALPSGDLGDGPVFLRGTFNITGTEPLLDTYLDTRGWGKGVAYVNDHNLGRYWPEVGPQVTLYVPGSYLKRGINELAILELESISANSRMNFTRIPNLGPSFMRD